MPAKKKTAAKKKVQKTLDFKIENIAGVPYVHLAFEPGMNVLLGPNGAGKSSSINALRRAHGDTADDMDPAVVRRDGAASGTVYQGDVCLLKVGQIARGTGKAEVSVADTSPVSEMIDPHIKKDDSRAAARIRALVQLLELGVEPKFLTILADGDKNLVKFAIAMAEDEVIEDLLVLAGRMKKHTEGLARVQEELIADATSRHEQLQSQRAQVLQDLDGEENLVEISEEAAREALVAASRELERTESARHTRVELEASQARVRASLGDRVDPTAAAKASRAALMEHGAACDLVSDLKAKLAVADERLTAAGKRILACDLDEANAKEAAQILAKTPEGPDQEEVDAASTHAQKASDTMRKAALSDRARTYAEDSQGCEDTIAECEGKAAYHRELAQSMPGRLAGVLEEAGAPGLTVVDGRLAVVTGTGTGTRKDPQIITDFEKRHSEGQRARIVLAIAAHRYKGLMPIDWQFWACLDPDAKAEFAGICAELGLYGITEATARGDLRVEHLG